MEKNKRGFWSKLWEFLTEIFGELIVMLLAFGIGAGILWLLGRKDLVRDMNPESVVLLGMLAAVAVTIILLVIVALIKKRKNKRKIEP